MHARLLAGRGTLNKEHYLQEPPIVCHAHMSRPISPKRHMLTCRVQLFPQRDIYSHVASNDFPEETYAHMSRPIISPKRHMLTCRVQLFPQREIC